MTVVLSLCGGVTNSFEEGYTCSPTHPEMPGVPQTGELQGMDNYEGERTAYHIPVLTGHEQDAGSPRLQKPIWETTRLQ